jgi:methyl coenzyme M reductase gamma subunit
MSKKKMSIFLVFTLLFSLILPGFSQASSSIVTKTETFDNFKLTGTAYVNGSFVGVDGITWTYTGARNQESYPINGNGIMFKDSLKYIESSNISGGISSFSVDLKKGFTSTKDRQVEVFINNVSIGKSVPFNDTTVHNFSVNNINMSGNFKIKIVNVADGNQVVVDNITWSSYEVTTPTKVNSVTSNSTSGPVPVGTEVQLSTSTEGATIYYTTNGDNPTAGSTVYTSPIVIDQDTTIKAFATLTGSEPSDIATFNYTILDVTSPAAPVVNPVTNADELITGTAEANASVIAMVNGQEIGTSIVDTDGYFTISIPKQEVGTTIFVTAKDSTGNNSSATEITVTRATLKVNSVLLSVDKHSPQVIGTPVTLTANSSGSLEPEYRFIVRENGNLTILQEYGDNNTITWTPSHSGIFTIIVHAKDKMADGSGLLFEARTDMTYAINGGKVTNVQLSSDLSSPQVLGTPISLKATTEGSLEPEYRFIVREDGKLTTLQKYGSSDSLTWIPSHSGIYTIIVHTKDKMADGSGLLFEARAEMTYAINGGKVTNVQVSSNLSSPQVLGTPISLKTTSTGSLEPEYRFFIREDGNLTTLQEYGSNDSITWTPTHSGIYTIIVHAKDKMAFGGGLLFEARTEMTYVVNAGKVTNIQVNSDLSSPLILGTPISLKATSTGSLEPEYRFFVLGDGNLTTLQEYGNKDTLTWIPSKRGTYTIIIHAKDKMASGAGLQYEARTEITFIVK